MEQKPEGESLDRTSWGNGRIAYTAHAMRIHQRIQAGWPLKKIYQELEAQLMGLSYQQFTYHVRKNNPKPVSKAPGSLEASPAMVLETGLTPEKKGSLDEKPKAPPGDRPVKPGRFKPGPLVPDPSELY